MSLITRDEMMQSNYFDKEQVELPELGEGKFVYVRTISAWAQGKIDNAQTKVKGKKIEIDLVAARAMIAVHACCDETGKTIFQPGDEKWLVEKCAKSLGRIEAAYRRLNVVGGGDGELLEEIEKN